MITEQQTVLFFDGYCNLCNRTVIFIIKHDKKKIFKFASLQSKIGKKAIAELSKQSIGNIDSVILWYDGKYYIESQAVIKAISLFGGIWRLSKIGLIFPSFISNGFYKWIARNRYHWFGKNAECMLPMPELQSRFIED